MKRIRSLARPLIALLVSAAPAFVCLVLTVLAIAPRANAGLIFYGSRAAFDAAAPGLPVEDFEEARVVAWGAVSMSGDLDKNTNNAVFQTGEILDGLRLRERPPRGSDGLAIAGAGFAGEPSKDVFANFFVDTLDLFFYNNDVDAAGMDLFSKFGGSTLDISVFDSSGLLGSTTAAASSVGTFVGVSTTAGEIITRINLSSQTGEAEGVDNVAFGRQSQVIPEPGTLTLLGIGLAALVAAQRRKKK